MIHLRHRTTCPPSLDDIHRFRGPFYLHSNYNEAMARDILSASGRKTENGSGESCPILNLRKTPPACGSEYQNEQTTHMYPNHGCQEPPACPPVIRPYAHCTKSSTLIANACHRKKTISPTVLSAKLMLTEDGSITMDPACITAEMVKAIHRCEYEYNVDPFVSPKRRDAAVEKLVRL